MMRRQVTTQVMALVIGLLMFANTSAATLGWQDTHVIELRGKQLPMLLGMPQERLSVVRWSADEGFAPVPFQIDEYGAADLVWFASTGLHREEEAGIMAPEDMLLLKASDAGARAPKEVEPEYGSLVAEIKVSHRGDDYYFYVVTDSPRRSAETYVQHNLTTGVTRTASYTLKVDPKNELNWTYLSHVGYQGEGSIIDTLKMRMSAGFMSRRARVTLDNHNLRPRVTGFKVGPIRSVMHLETRVVITGISVMKLQLQAYRYPDHYEAHSHAVIPALYKAMLKAPEVTVSIDGNAQYGATVQTANSEGVEAVVKGEPNVLQQKLIDKGLDANNSWILFNSQKNFTLLAYLDLPESLADTPLALVFEDDKELENKPEQFPGQLPNLGYALKDWPPEKELRFSVKMYFDQSLEGQDIASYTHHRTQAATVVVKALGNSETH